MDFSPDVGLWLGFALSLMIFSLVVRDNLLARLAQYILVGAATGYLIVMIIQDILRPKLFEPIFSSDTLAFDLLVPLVLGIGLVLAGIDGTIRQGLNDAQTNGSNSGQEKQPNLLHAIVMGIGRVALMLMIGVGLANAATGTIQGTLLPQFWHATRLRAAWGANSNELLSNEPVFVGTAVALFLTIATILHLYVVPTRKEGAAASRAFDSNENLPYTDDNPASQLTSVWVDNFVVQSWAAIGKRAIWFAAGVLFARLAASRLSLVIARIEYFVQVLERTSFWQGFIQSVESLF